jgi:hypothetical protein
MPILLVSMLLAASSCGARGALVTVANDSPDTLWNVVVSGRGFADTLARLLPNESGSIRARPGGESGIGVAFTAKNRRIAVPEQGYFEPAGGYIVEVRVDSTLGVRVQSGLGAY